MEKKLKMYPLVLMQEIVDKRKRVESEKVEKLEDLLSMVDQVILIIGATQKSTMVTYFWKVTIGNI